MGTIIDPIAIKVQSDGIVSKFTEKNKTLMSIFPTLTNFESEPELSGAAWSGVKRQIEGHRSIIQGLICANESVIADSEALVLAVGNELLDEDLILAEIDRLRSWNNNYYRLKKSFMTLPFKLNSQPFYREVQGMSAYYDGQFSAYLNGNNQAIARLQSKLNKITQIMSITESLYANSDRLFGHVSTGIAELEKGGSSNSFTGIKNSNWQVALDKSWQKREETEGQSKVYSTRYIYDYMQHKPQLTREKASILYPEMRGTGMAVLGGASKKVEGSQTVTLKKATKVFLKRYGAKTSSPGQAVNLIGEFK